MKIPTLEESRNMIYDHNEQAKVAYNLKMTRRWEYILEYNKIIDKLILETPTGELRNTYTDLNILFHSILELG